MRRLFITLFLLQQAVVSVCALGHVPAYNDGLRGNYRDERAGASNNANVIYQRLEFKVDPAVNYISGKVTTYFIPGSDISYFEFDLTDTLTVDSVVFHRAEIPFAHTDNIIHADLPNVVVAASTDSIAVYYHGAPAQGEGFGSFIQTKHDSVPVIWTLSEPYGASDWWPCKQNLSDKIDSIDVLITCPAIYRAASNGLLVEELQSGNDKTYHWKHRYPIATYLVCMAVTNYVTFTLHAPFNGNNLPVLNYVYPEDSAKAAVSFPDVVSFIQLYDSLFGEYPFSKEKYGQVEFGWGGGMEHQTMTFVGGFDFELLAHELGHHWFGDKVTCGSWSDIWLNEGFATYLSGLCYEHLDNKWWLPFKISRIAGATKEPSGSVWCDDTSTVGRIFDAHLSYSKGAMVLHMLRWTLGDSLFFAGLRSYLNDVQNAYAFAVTDDLKLHLEVASGKNLDAFFDAWVYGRGFPSYQFSWTQDFSKQVTLTIGQTQSDPSVAFFSMPLPVKFKSATQDTVLVFDHTHAGQSFSFSLPFFADSLFFDPDYWIISANNTVTRQGAYNLALILYPNPVNDVLQLRIDNAADRSSEIRIFNQLGQNVWKGDYKLNEGSNLFNIDVSGFQSGVYGVVVTADKQRQTSKFVISEPRK